MSDASTLVEDSEGKAAKPPASAQQPSARRAAPPPARRRTSARFVTCVVTLVAFALVLSGAKEMFGLYFRKEAVPLKKRLARMEKSKLAPQYGLHPNPPPPLNDDVIKTLGTEEYLNWRIVDRTRSQSDPTCVANVFITYYTGQPDMVPHVPDECYKAGGYDIAETRNTLVHVPGVRAREDEVPIRAVLLEQRGSLLRRGANQDLACVMYFFHCNGEYATTRNDVRRLQSSLWDRYAYYAKIEVRFTDFSLMRTAGFDASVEAIGPLLEKLLPILLEDHFADWDALNSDSAPTAA
jgi:hypothetical protein